MQKETINFKERKEGNMRGFGGSKWKGEMNMKGHEYELV